MPNFFRGTVFPFSVSSYLRVKLLVHPITLYNFMKTSGSVFHQPCVSVPASPTFTYTLIMADPVGFH